MNYSLDQLPQKYKPFRTIDVFSNTLEQGAHLFVMNNDLPLIIGKGAKNKSPKVWLWGVDKGMHLIPLVSDSVSQYTTVKVRSRNNTTKVFVRDTEVLRVVGNDDKAQVEKLDLRPTGINAFGAENTLIVGQSTFKGNTMKGGVFIGLAV